MISKFYVFFYFKIKTFRFIEDELNEKNNSIFKVMFLFYKRERKKLKLVGFFLAS